MDSPQNRLELDSRLSELSRVQPWVESLADRHGFEEEARFAMQLCIEEALANVVLHGYRGEPGHPIVIQASVSAGILSSRSTTTRHHFPQWVQVRKATRPMRLPSNRLNLAETVSGCFIVSQDRSPTKDCPTAIDLP